MRGAKEFLYNRERPMLKRKSEHGRRRPAPFPRGEPTLPRSVRPSFAVSMRYLPTLNRCEETVDAEKCSDRGFDFG